MCSCYMNNNKCSTITQAEKCAKVILIGHKNVQMFPVVTLISNKDLQQSSQFASLGFRKVYSQCTVHTVYAVLEWINIH